MTGCGGGCATHNPGPDCHYVEVAPGLLECVICKRTVKCYGFKPAKR